MTVFVNKVGRAPNIQLPKLEINASAALPDTSILAADSKLQNDA